MKKVTLCAPSRIYEDHPNGRFSCSAMVDFFETVGIGAIDMSFESLSRYDDSWESVLYSTARKAQSKGIDLPVCHLSFYMPDPNNAELMAKYTRELFRGINAAKLMGIPRAVVHPISFYSSERTYGDWVRANMAFLTPVVEYAKSKGVRLCVENMPSEKEAPDNHLYGSCALNVSALAEKLGIGVCWDVGHANISGYTQSEQMQILKGRIEVLHIHDNGGSKDAHLIPFDGGVDWADVAKGIKESEFCGILDVEVTAWALSGDRDIRENFGKTIVSRAHRLMEMADLIG